MVSETEALIRLRGEELGSSLYKILVSEKYDKFDYNQTIDILEKAANEALLLLMRDQKDFEDKE